MKIAPLGNNQISSNGYLDKSVYRYVNKSADNTISELSALFDKMPKKQINATIAKINEDRRTTILNLETYMNSCDSNTYMAIDTANGASAAMIINSKTQKLKNGIAAITALLLGEQAATVEVIPPIREHSKYSSTDDLMTMLNDADLEQIKRFSDALVKKDSALLDEIITDEYNKQLKNHKNILSGIWAKIKNKIN